MGMKNNVRKCKFCGKEYSIFVLDAHLDGHLEEVKRYKKILQEL